VGHLAARVVFLAAFLTGASLAAFLLAFVATSFALFRAASFLAVALRAATFAFDLGLTRAGRCAGRQRNGGDRYGQKTSFVHPAMARRSRGTQACEAGGRGIGNRIARTAWVLLAKGGN
jgi:hypothetical protein